MEENGRMILEIGCGEPKVYEHSLGLDIRKTTKTDIIADARRLPFEDGVFDLIFSSHSIEHISHRETRSTLAEWIRVLRPDGVIEVICPDLRARAAIFAARPTWDGVMKIYEDQDYPENSHLSSYSFGLLKGILISLGIGRIKRTVKGYKGIPFIPNSLHVRGIKLERNSRVVETNPRTGEGD
jgi:predicted SAM-dependent methyltransferase